MSVLTAGIFDLMFVLFHAVFWRLFGWKVRLRSLESINRSLMPVMNIALIILLAVNGLAPCLYPDEVLQTGLGRFLLGGMTAFWVIRAAVQQPYFGWRHPASIALQLVSQRPNDKDKLQSNCSGCRHRNTVVGQRRG